ncbi:MAG TPA: hypothetical protein VGY99_24160 [Candidatus Binataceae bacterium]|jgi:hypothetical protein|nr:hypothetical protein [Candidatus Binataceae bacterium]
MAKDKGTDEALKELGIDPSEPEQAVERLRSLRSSGGADPAKIAAAAGQVASPGAAQILVEMEAGASGTLRREVRRALFKLRQHGIESPSAEAPPAAAVIATEPNINALISPIDSTGARLVWLFKARGQGGLSRMYGLTSESEGLVGANLVHVSRRELREERQEIERQSSIKMIEADYRLADFMLCEAYRRTPEARLGHVGSFLALRAEILAASPPTDYHHPIYDEFADTLSQEPSIELLKEPELGGWIIAQSDLKPYLDEIEEIRQSPLVLNKYQQEERVNAVVGRAVEQLFAGERAKLMRRRLEDTAYYLARTGRADAARWAASAAARIRDGEPLARGAFFIQYVMRSMGLVLSEQETEAEQQPRLIMTPAEAMRAQTAARMARQRR